MPVTDDRTTEERFYSALFSAYLKLPGVMVYRDGNWIIDPPAKAAKIGTGSTLLEAFRDYEESNGLAHRRF